MRPDPVARSLCAAVFLLAVAACGGGESADTMGGGDPGAGTLIDTAATPAGGMTGGMPASGDTVPTGADTVGGAGGR